MLTYNNGYISKIFIQKIFYFQINSIEYNYFTTPNLIYAPFAKSAPLHAKTNCENGNTVAPSSASPFLCSGSGIKTKHFFLNDLLICESVRRYMIPNSKNKS